MRPDESRGVSSIDAATCGDSCLNEPGMHDTITEHLAKALREALTGAGLPIPDEVAWEVPRDEAHGDYATNVAMALARPAKKAPRQIADAIVAQPSTITGSIGVFGGKFALGPALAKFGVEKTTEILYAAGAEEVVEIAEIACRSNR